MFSRPKIDVQFKRAGVHAASKQVSEWSLNGNASCTKLAIYSNNTTLQSVQFTFSVFHYFFGTLPAPPALPAQRLSVPGLQRREACTTRCDDLCIRKRHPTPRDLRA